jgi:hypothetical protein
MRLAIIAGLATLALAGCGADFKPANYCFGPTAQEGYEFAADGSRVSCIATHSNAGSATAAGR